jgi:hypothetical protein
MLEEGANARLVFVGEGSAPLHSVMNFDRALRLCFSMHHNASE